MKSFRELEVWKRAMELTDQVYDLVAKFPKEERYGSSKYLVENALVRAFGRYTKARCIAERLRR